MSQAACDEPARVFLNRVRHGLPAGRARETRGPEPHHARGGRSAPAAHASNEAVWSHAAVRPGHRAATRGYNSHVPRAIAAVAAIAMAALTIDAFVQLPATLESPAHDVSIAPRDSSIAARDVSITARDATHAARSTTTAAPRS